MSNSSVQRKTAVLRHDYQPACSKRHWKQNWPLMPRYQVALPSSFLSARHFGIRCIQLPKHKAPKIKKERWKGRRFVKWVPGPGCGHLRRLQEKPRFQASPGFSGAWGGGWVWCWFLRWTGCSCRSAVCALQEWATGVPFLGPVPAQEKWADGARLSDLLLPWVQ